MTPQTPASPAGLTIPLPAFCPKCRAPATPKPSAQSCGGCGTRFTLVAGKASDASVQVPPVTPGAKELKLKAPGIVMVSIALLNPEWIGFGMLDPVVGAFPMDTKKVRFADIQAVCVWRALSVSQLLTFLLISLPVGLGSIVMMIAASFHPAALIAGLPFLALCVFHGWRTLGLRATRTVIYQGGKPALDMTFVGSLSKRRKFYAELCRRAGLAPIALP